MTEIRISDDFYHYCMSKLNHAQFTIYIGIMLLGIGFYSQRDIQEICQVSARTCSRHLPSLKKLGFIYYSAVPGRGLYLHWVRLGIDDKIVNVVPKEHRWRVIDPEGKVHLICPGSLKHFCIRNNLDIGNMSRMLNGITSNHKGWRL